MKIRVGILFGGRSREREIAFAGGRTVYDNLNKSLFDPVPLFVDSTGRFIRLHWPYVYKGSIRDFYPPVPFLPPSPHHFQIYRESLGQLDAAREAKMIQHIGEPVSPEALPELIDFAFLALHGPYGEDGTVQGLLEYYDVPYSGAGIFASAVGINKVLQKRWLKKAGFELNPYLSLTRDKWLQTDDPGPLFKSVCDKLGKHFVVKSAHQGSSLGVTILEDSTLEHFVEAVDRSFFTYRLTRKAWQQRSEAERIHFIRDWVDVRTGIGLPAVVGARLIHHPEELLDYLNKAFDEGKQALRIEAVEGESEVLLEPFLKGKEFSCIVVANDDGEPTALPPTEIVKGAEVFDYRSKYLAGHSRKRTPIELPERQIERIAEACERLYRELEMQVYARIDGLITAKNKIYLNDPNTTSGMLPSSFFFHQAAEAGMNPSQFLTFIIRASLQARLRSRTRSRPYRLLLGKLDGALEQARRHDKEKTRVAVIMGGYTTERHISVESGRNIHEKLAASAEYEPVPVFLAGHEKGHKLYLLPINLLLKDNADDIREKISRFSEKPFVKKLRQRLAPDTGRFVTQSRTGKPQPVTYKDLARQVDAVFIALHGRPGEDGTVQQHLKKVGLPFNGSDVQSAQITIDKYKTNRVLKEHGLPVLKQVLVKATDWKQDKKGVQQAIEKTVGFPCIAKPVDEGCSAAVKKIIGPEELEAYAKLLFRKKEGLPEDAARQLAIDPKEELPRKVVFLAEELATSKGARHFMEITGGLLTHYNKQGRLEYELFEPSETVASREILTLEEKFLAGEGQNITPARYSEDEAENKRIAATVRRELGKVARILKLEGYARIDAFVRIFDAERVEVLVLEVNALPGMTPATAIFHQAALNDYKPYDFMHRILQFGMARQQIKQQR